MIEGVTGDVDARRLPLGNLLTRVAGVLAGIIPAAPGATLAPADWPATRAGWPTATPCSTSFGRSRWFSCPFLRRYAALFDALAPKRARLAGQRGLQYC